MERDPHIPKIEDHGRERESTPTDQCPSPKRICMSNPDATIALSASHGMKSHQGPDVVRSNVTTVGVHLLTTEGLGVQFGKYINEVWSCLMYDYVLRIGIHGIGGVGKTEVAKHINNMLLQNPNKFHHVFWVDMSPDWSICNRPTVSPPRRVRDLQSSISKAVGLDLSDGDGESKRAAQLSKGLGEKKKSVLILDDVWDYIPLQEVGIPVGVDRCTVVFTTRSLGVCRQLGCQRKIEIRCLPPDESYELFKKNLGKETTVSGEVEEISKLVADKCAGLPLAITIMTRYMKGVTDIRRWRNALEGHTRKKADMEIFQKLKVSYDYLKDATLQHCFLYFPSFAREYKDTPYLYLAFKNRLVENLVDAGIIKRMNSRRKELDEAHTMLDFLHEAGLLEITRSKDVEMNALVRNMALQIMEENNQRAMIKNYISLKDLPDEKSWSGDLVRVSLQGNKIENIHSNYSPSCSKLSTLLLSENLELGYIGDNFFSGMPGLKVLDLTHTSIENFPSSIYGLVNLTTLILAFCRKLRKFPLVAKLRALEKLDLRFSSVEGVAKDIEKLSELTYLDLGFTHVELEPGVLAKLSHLQFLRLPWSPAVKGDEVACLSRLETLSCSFYDVVELNKYLLHLKGPIQLDVTVGPGPIYRYGFMNDEFYDEDGDDEEDKDLGMVALNNCNINEVDMLIYFKEIAVVQCNEARSLCSPIKSATELKHITIMDCDGLQFLCSLPAGLEKVEYMELLNLKNLSVLFSCKEGNAASYGSCFSNLTRFLIKGCPSIKRLFPIHVCQNLKKLERLYVIDCVSMEEIFAAEEEEEESTSIAESKKMCSLPKLSIIDLIDLPEVKTLCGRGISLAVTPHCSLGTRNCPNLKTGRQKPL